MTRTGIRATIILAVSLSLWVLALPVGAASLDASGWWWRPQTNLGGIQAPTPPDVPEGGLLVESTPQQTTAIGAVRFMTRSDEVHPTLTLAVADAANTGDAELAACPAGAEWQAAHGGSWDDKPSAACGEGSVAGIPAEDGSEWTFPVSALVPVLVEGTIDVVIVPGKTESGGDPSFRIAFERPTSRSLQTRSETPDVSVPSGGTSTEPDPAATATGGRSEGSGPSAPALAGSTSSTPGPTPAPVFDPALDPDDQEVTSSAPLRRVDTTAAEGEHRDHWIAAAVLALGTAAALWLLRQPLPAPRRLGSLAARHAGAGDPGEARWRRRLSPSATRRGIGRVVLFGRSSPRR